MATYLQFAPEHGGMQFGPFHTGSIYLGSDSSRCQVILHASNGVAPLHAVLTLNAGGDYSLSPTQMGLGLFYRKAGHAQLLQVTAPVQLDPGDSVILGNQSGPRFVLLKQAAQHSAYGAQPGRAPPGLATQVGEEAKRQMVSSMFTRNPLFSEAYQWWYRAKTGTLTQPRFLISAAISVLTFLFMAIVVCFGTVIGMVKFLQ